MVKLLIDLRSSFWFIPSLIVVLFAALAVCAVELDVYVADQALNRYPKIFGAGAEGARQLLSAIASSTITVAGVVFSITIVALSITSAQYLPRVLRNFMRDRGNQLVLGIFVGIYTYCLIVLRTVRGGEQSFVPDISGLVAILLALVGVGFLIYFIHHIATSIQVSEIAARVARETLRAIDESFPRPLHEANTLASDIQLPVMSWKAIPARTTGYIQTADVDELMRIALSREHVLRIEKAIGEFVIEGHPLLWVAGAQVDETLIELLNGAFAINTYRDLTQDPAFGIQQLVDIALKGLSTGINDTTTARNSVDYITAVLCRVAERCLEEDRYRLENGKVVLVTSIRSFEQLVSLAFDPIRRNSVGNVDMALYALGALAELGRVTSTPHRRSVVARQIIAIAETLDRSRLGEHDKRQFDAQVTIALASAAEQAPATARRTAQ